MNYRTFAAWFLCAAERAKRNFLDTADMIITIPIPQPHFKAPVSSLNKEPFPKKNLLKNRDRHDHTALSQRFAFVRACGTNNSKRLKMSVYYKNLGNMWIMSTGKVDVYFTCVTVCADDDDSRLQSAETDTIYFYLITSNLHAYFI